MISSMPASLDKLPTMMLALAENFASLSRSNVMISLPYPPAAARSGRQKQFHKAARGRNQTGGRRSVVAPAEAQTALTEQRPPKDLRKSVISFTGRLYQYNDQCI